MSIIRGFDQVAGAVRQGVARRPRLLWLAAIALPLIVAACNNNGGSGY